MENNKELEIALTTYIALKHSQEECSGFIDGFKEAKALQLLQTDVSQQRELLEAYQHFIDWNEEHDRKASTSERIEAFITSNCG